MESRGGYAYRPGVPRDYRGTPGRWRCAISVMKTHKSAIVILAAAAILLISFFSPRLTLRVQDMRSGVKLYQAPVKEGDEFTIEFVHSVERTPVKEVFRIEEDCNIYVVETEYESFGAGLPTIHDEGEESLFKEGKIRITGMRRKLEPFLVAVSPVPGHVLTVGGEEVVLASLAEPGTGLRISVVREPAVVRFLGRRY